MSNIQKSNLYFVPKIAVMGYYRHKSHEGRVLYALFGYIYILIFGRIFGIKIFFILFNDKVDVIMGVHGFFLMICMLLTRRQTLMSKNLTIHKLAPHILKVVLFHKLVMSILQQTYFN